MTKHETVKLLQEKHEFRNDELAEIILLIQKQAKVLDDAEKALSHAIENQEWSHEETTILGEALANIRAAKQGK